MKRTLSDHDRNRLDALISDVEKRTNTQIVLALIQRSDIYAELPWKAFALGASVSGLLVFIMDILSYGWNPQVTVIIAVAGILVLVSLFERKVVILSDTGLSDLLQKDAMKNIIAAMTPFLKRSEISRAFETGLEQLTKILGTKVQGTGKNELSDEIIEEKGV